ncbi:hypothetical protein FRC01_004384 [Tulasnella sp. 417]|nr:hypothetical protein FRC01_004384 [Tulasnella sp. 417]
MFTYLLRCPIKKRPPTTTSGFSISEQKPTTLSGIQKFHIHVPITHSFSIPPLATTRSRVHLSRAPRKLDSVDEPDAFRKTAQASCSALFKIPAENALPLTGSGIHSEPGRPYPAAPRSAPPTTPSRSTLPEEPGSSPFPEEDEDEKDDGPGVGGERGGSRAGTGDLDELEEFYGTKESSPSKDAGENEGEQSRSQSLNLKDPYGFQTQAFPRSTLGEDSY